MITYNILNNIFHNIPHNIYISYYLPNFSFQTHQDERETVQKKTFTKWINSHLQKVSAHINDLYHDLQDGRNLILLLEILSAEKLVRTIFMFGRLFIDLFIQRFNL